MATKQIKSIPLKGIVRNTSDEATEDGGLLEAINLRHKDGSWRGAKDKLATGFRTQQADNFGVPYYHSVLPANTYVLHNETDNTICTVLFHATTDNTPVVQLTLAVGEVFDRFSHMNNTLLVFTSVKKYLLYWNKDTASYVDLTFLPIPIIALGDGSSYEGHVITAVGDNLVADTLPDYGFSAAQNFGEYFRINVIGDFLKQKAELNKDRYIEGFIMVRVAYRLFDGNYILASQPYLHHVGYHATKQPVFSVNDSAPYFYGTITQNYLAVPVAYYNFFNTGDFTLSEQDKMGIVESMDIFSTRPVEAYDYMSSIPDWTVMGGSGFNLTYHPPFNNILFSEMIESGQYYKVATIPIKDIIKDGFKADFKGLDYSKDITSNELLPPDNFTHHQYNSLADYTYNNRIHLGNIINTLSPTLNNLFHSNVIIPGMTGYQSFESVLHADIQTKLFGAYTNTSAGMSTATHKIYQQAWLNTNEGRKIVTTELQHDNVATFDGGNIPATFNYYIYNNGSTNALFLNPIISYPDYRAYKLRYYYTYGGTKYFLADFDLKPNTALNTASYISPLILTDGSTGNYYPIKIDLPATTGTAMPSDDPLTDDVITDTNRVQVSEQSNPFFWPAVNSYRFGLNENTVIAIAGVQSAMSDSAFGQYPLYVFSKSGVYGMQTGNGEVLYQSIQHLNNEILLKRYSLVSITGAIVFACKEGIRIIQGGVVKELSIPVEGGVTNPVSSKAQFIDALSGYSMPQVLAYMSNITFSAYIADCILLFDVENRELVISAVNQSVLYSYVYSFYTNVWTTRTEVFAGSMVVDGRMIGVKKQSVLVGTPEDPTTTYSYTGSYSAYTCMLVPSGSAWINNATKRTMNILIRKFATTSGVTTEVLTDGYPLSKDGKLPFPGYAYLAQADFDRMNVYHYAQRFGAFQAYLMYSYPGIECTWSDNTLSDAITCPIPTPNPIITIENIVETGTYDKSFDVVVSDNSVKTINYYLYVKRLGGSESATLALSGSVTDSVTAHRGALSNYISGNITITGTAYLEINVWGVPNPDTNITDVSGYIILDGNPALKLMVSLIE